MDNQDIRWKQRFQNFTKSMRFLESALQIPNPDIVQKAGIIQFFEMSFELAWNVVKDYLEEQGFVDIKSPRGTLKKAFEIGIIENGHDWMSLLLDRNLTAHTYDEEKATEVEQLIRNKYFPLLKVLYNSFKLKLDEK
jgi:nucleotidyltransferase substrate binding protein (TIGR01987 family)